MQLATPLSHIGNIKADTVKYLLTVREPGQSGGALRRGYRSLVGSFSGLCCSKRQKSVGRCLILLPLSLVRRRQSVERASSIFFLFEIPAFLHFLDFPAKSIPELQEVQESIRFWV